MKNLVRWVLEHSRCEDWTVQGFGFMRMYLTRGNESTRLHIWNSSLRVDGVSDLHTHPWDFDSTIICGKLGNRRFTEYPGEQYSKGLLKAGEGAYVIGNAIPIDLSEQAIEYYGPGSKYIQLHNEIHRTIILRENTVTLINRIVKTENPDHAYVYWPRSGKWVDAAPRPATSEEWHIVVGGALTNLRKS